MSRGSHTPPSSLPYWLGCAALVLLYAMAQQRDEMDEALAKSAAANDARMAAVQARRETMARTEFCLKTQGPATQPIEQQDGTFRCTTKRGKDAGATTAAALQVAQQ